MALRLAQIRALSQRHATRIPNATPKEPNYAKRSTGNPEELVSHAIFLFNKAARLAFDGYLLRSIHVFGFAEGLLYAAGVFSIEELRHMRPNGKTGSRTGFRARIRRGLYKIGEWFFEIADRL